MRSNNPFTIFEEDEEPNKPSATTDTTTSEQLPLQATIPPYDPCIQEMLDQPTQATRAIHDLRPQCRAAPTATPTIHPSPTIHPRSKPTQTFTPTILPTSKPTKNATLPAGPAFIQLDQHSSNPITTSVMITAILGLIPRLSHGTPSNSCLLEALPILLFRHSTT